MSPLMAILILLLLLTLRFVVPLVLSIFVCNIMNRWLKLQ